MHKLEIGLLISSIIFCQNELSAQEIVFESQTSLTEQEIRNELKVYPKDTVLKCVEKIIIRKNDLAAGVSSWVNKEIEISTISESYFKRTLHHELSSLFLFNIDGGYKHPSANEFLRKFIKLNPVNFKYAGYDVHHWTYGELTSEEAKYFADDYSLTSVENDFNVICEKLFTDKNFILSLDTASNLYKKTLLAINFYRSRIDEKFTLEFFKSLRHE